MSTHESKTTKDHDTIKKWVEERDGRPALVNGTGDTGKGDGLLRFNFPGYDEDNLEEISWEKFFTIFDENDLQLLYQEETKDGETSRFFKFISDNDQ